jgi:hypothetical protein
LCIQLDNLKGRDFFENISMDGRLILQWILKKQDMRVRIRFVRLRAQGILSKVINLRFPLSGREFVI